MTIQSRMNNVFAWYCGEKGVVSNYLSFMYLNYIEVDINIPWGYLSTPKVLFRSTVLYSELGEPGKIAWLRWFFLFILKTCTELLFSCRRRYLDDSVYDNKKERGPKPLSSIWCNEFLLLYSFDCNNQITLNYTKGIELSLVGSLQELLL